MEPEKKCTHNSGKINHQFFDPETHEFKIQLIVCGHCGEVLWKDPEIKMNIEKDRRQKST